QGTTHWQHQIVDVVLQRLVALLTDPELRNHGEVNEGKRHQRTKVNQRSGRYQVEFNRQQGNSAHQQHVPRRGTPFRMHVTEEAGWEHTVTAHHVHQTRNARVRSHTGSQYG